MSCTPVDRFVSPSVTAGFVTQVEGAGLVVDQVHRQALTRLATAIRNHPEVAGSSNVVQAILWSQTTGFSELAALQPSAPTLEEIGLSMGLLRDPDRDLPRALWVYTKGRLAKQSRKGLSPSQAIHFGLVSEQARAETPGLPLAPGTPVDLQAILVAFASQTAPSTTATPSPDTPVVQSFCAAKLELSRVLKDALSLDVVQCN
jgi:hypothetical protein